MNGGRHAALPEWVCSELGEQVFSCALDIGCGGGANIQRMLNKFPEATVTGLDLSNEALDIAHELNYPPIMDKRCAVVGGNVIQMPFAKNIFDLVTAFETV